MPSPITIDYLEKKKENQDNVVELSISELLELIHNTNEAEYSSLIIKYIGRYNATEVSDLTKTGDNPINVREEFEIDVARSKTYGQTTQICVINKTCYFDTDWNYYSKDHQDKIVM